MPSSHSLVTLVKSALSDTKQFPYLSTVNNRSVSDKIYNDRIDVCRSYHTYHDMDDSPQLDTNCSIQHTICAEVNFQDESELQGFLHFKYIYKYMNCSDYYAYDH